MQYQQVSKSNMAYAKQADSYLKTATYAQACKVYATILDDPCLSDDVLAELGKTDRFFLLAQILRRPDMYHPWLYERCREVEKQPDGCLDLWARGHYKSTIITFGGTFQEIINNPDITICILSYTRPIAKSFLGQIKIEMESNLLLKKLYPWIFWSNPKSEAPKWSLDDGITVRRDMNPKESSVEAWGLVDSQPTAKHYDIIIYNDVVVEISITPDMIIKTTKAWELSRNLLSTEFEGAKSKPRSWHEGTRYSYSDTYGTILQRKALTPRLHPATDNGLPGGKPVFLTNEAWERKKKEESPRVIACQQLQNPIAGEEQEFKIEWIRNYEIRPKVLNVAILVDPANSKKKSSCNTAMAVIGVDQQHNKYLLDGACHKMGLKDRWKMLKYLRFKWIRQPGIQVVMVGYEKYGMQADIEHFTEMMEIEKSPFPIEEVSWTRDLEQAKDDRIRRLIPDHQNWRFFYPYQGDETSLQSKTIAQKLSYLLAKPIKRKDHEGKYYNLTEWFFANEYLFFPATTNKDFLDAMSRIYDININPPQIINDEDILPEWEGDW